MGAEASLFVSHELAFTLEDSRPRDHCANGGSGRTGAPTTTFAAAPTRGVPGTSHAPARRTVGWLSGRTLAAGFLARLPAPPASFGTRPPRAPLRATMAATWAFAVAGADCTPGVAGVQARQVSARQQISSQWRNRCHRSQESTASSRGFQPVRNACLARLQRLIFGADRPGARAASSDVQKLKSDPARWAANTSSSARVSLPRNRHETQSAAASGLSAPAATRGAPPVAVAE